MGQETTGSRGEGMRGLAALKQATASLARRQQSTQPVSAPPETSESAPVAQEERTAPPPASASLAHRGSTRKVPDPSELRLLGEEPTDDPTHAVHQHGVEPTESHTRPQSEPNEWSDSPLNRFLKDQIKTGQGRSVISVTEHTASGSADNAPGPEIAPREKSPANHPSGPSAAPPVARTVETTTQELPERHIQTTPVSPPDQAPAGTSNWIKAVAHQNRRSHMPSLSPRQESGGQTTTQFSQHRKKPKQLRDVPFTTAVVPGNHLTAPPVEKPGFNHADKGLLPRGMSTAPAARRTAVAGTGGQSPFLKHSAQGQEDVVADKAAPNTPGGHPTVASKVKSDLAPVPRPPMASSTPSAAVPNVPSRTRSVTNEASLTPTAADTDIHRRQAIGDVGALLNRMPNPLPTANQRVVSRTGSLPAVKAPQNPPSSGKPTAPTPQPQVTPPSRVAPPPPPVAKSPPPPSPGPKPAPRRIIIQGKDPVEIGTIVKQAAMNTKAAFTPATTPGTVRQTNSVKIGGKSLPGPAPQGNRPKPPAPQGNAPKPPAPQGNAPKPPAPQGNAPKPPAPQGNAPKPPAPQGNAPQETVSSPTRAGGVAPQEKKGRPVGRNTPQPVVITAKAEPVQSPSTTAKSSARLVVTLPPKDERVASDSGKRLSIQTPSGQIHLSTRRRDDHDHHDHHDHHDETVSGASRVQQTAHSGTLPEDHSEPWRVPVEGLGSGIIHLLGDAVGSVVSLGSGGIQEKRSDQAPGIAKPGKITPPKVPGSGSVSGLDVVTRKFTGGVRGVFSGVGQIAGGSIDIVLGTLGTLGGVIVQTSGKLGLGSKR
ncbi:MAG: hypothetical protein HQL75_14600 [Magnetococcales bacterium]|nr:hypothetical protein [Magnetococcales bacterium]